MENRDFRQTVSPLSEQESRTLQGRAGEEEDS